MEGIHYVLKATERHILIQAIRGAFEKVNGKGRPVNNKKCTKRDKYQIFGAILWYTLHQGISDDRYQRIEQFEFYGILPILQHVHEMSKTFPTNLAHIVRRNAFNIKTIIMIVTGIIL